MDSEKSKYEAAIEAAKTFIEIAELAMQQHSSYDVNGTTYAHMQTGTAECGAAKRASMELTRELARFRGTGKAV